MSSPWRKIASVSSNVKKLINRICPPTILESHTTITQPVDVPPLNFPELPNRLRLLLDLGASEDHARLLYAQFIKACQNVDATLSQQYYAEAATSLSSRSFAIGLCSTYIQAYHNHLMLLRAQTIEQLWMALFSWTQKHFSVVFPTRDDPRAGINPSSTICVPSSKRKRQGRPSSLTAEQTFALNALFARDDQYSPEDKQSIAQTLNLKRDQVNRWFCNARARRKMGSRLPRRCGSLDSVRTTSSNLTSTESQQADQGATISEVASSTPVCNNGSPGLPIPTPGSAPELTNSTPELNTRSTATLGAYSLDVYLNYSVYFEPEQSTGDLMHNSPTRHDPGSSTTTIPALSSSASAKPQVVVTTVPFVASLYPQPQEWTCGVTSFNDPLLGCLESDPFCPLPSAPESQLSNHDLNGFDLSQW